jgi:hypothetical protein
MAAVPILGKEPADDLRRPGRRQCHRLAAVAGPLDVRCRRAGRHKNLVARDIGFDHGRAHRAGIDQARDQTGGPQPVADESGLLALGVQRGDDNDGHGASRSKADL